MNRTVLVHLAPLYIKQNDGMSISLYLLLFAIICRSRSWALPFFKVKNSNRENNTEREERDALTRSAPGLCSSIVLLLLLFSSTLLFSILFAYCIFKIISDS